MNVAGNNLAFPCPEVSKIVVLVVLISAPATSQGRVEDHGAARRFISPKYMFSMVVPVGWGVSTGLDTPVFFYAATSVEISSHRHTPGEAAITTESHGSVPDPGRSATTPEESALADVGAFASSSPPNRKLSRLRGDPVYPAR